MKNLLIGIFILGFTGLTYSQASSDVFESELRGITLVPANSSYFSAVSSGIKARRVIDLQSKVASFDITKSSAYEKEDKVFEFSFKKKEDHIHATYDRNGIIISSQERYKDIFMSQKVRNAVFNAYPGWSVEGNMYVVSYAKGKDTKRVYKVKIVKDNKHKILKLGADGNLL